MQQGSSHRSAEGHMADMEQTLQELQRMVGEYENELNMSKRDASPRGNPDTADLRKASLDMLAQAYRAAAETEPFLPSPDSDLPALLALRKTSVTIAESKAYLQSQGTSLEQARKRLETETARLDDQKALQVALEKRIRTLRDDVKNRVEMTSEQIRQERVAQLEQQKRDYDQGTSKLLKALNKFMDDHLGPMLAAEDLGGPVVGDLMEIDSGQLEAGVDARGKLKKGKEKRNGDGDGRQRRIDEIWGPSASDQGGQGGMDRERNEAVAAAAEMRRLTEELLNSLVESGGDHMAAYIQVPKETAAVRFLVRSKIAQFHPRDATRIRLIDFGRELDE